MLPKYLLPKCPVTKMSYYQNVLLPKCPITELSCYQNVCYQNVHYQSVLYQNVWIPTATHLRTSLAIPRYVSSSVTPSRIESVWYNHLCFTHFADSTRWL